MSVEVVHPQQTHWGLWDRMRPASLSAPAPVTGDGPPRNHDAKPSDAWRHIAHQRPVFMDRDRESALEHPSRRRIFEYLMEKKGASLSELSRILQCGWGAMHHHLHLLDCSGLIQSHKFGRDRLFFPPGVSQDDANTWAALHRRRAREVLEMVLERPGLYQKELLEELGMSRKVLREHVGLLKDLDLLEEQATPSRRFYFPTEKLKRLLPK